MSNIWDEFEKIISSIPEEDLASLHPDLSQYDLGDLNDLLWDRQRLQESIEQACTKLEQINVPSSDFKEVKDKLSEIAEALMKSKINNNYRPR